MESGQYARIIGRYLGMKRKGNMVTLYLGVVDPIVKRGETPTRQVFNKSFNFWDQNADKLEESALQPGTSIKVDGTLGAHKTEKYAFDWKGSPLWSVIPDEPANSMKGGMLPTDEEAVAAHKFHMEKSGGGNQGGGGGGDFAGGSSNGGFAGGDTW